MTTHGSAPRLVRRRVRQQHRDDDPGDDAQRVEVDAQRSEVEVADRRARDAGDDARRACGCAMGHGCVSLAGRDAGGWRDVRSLSRGAGRTGPAWSRRAAFHAAVAEGADQRGADDRAVGVLEHSRHLLGVRDPDADARVLGAVRAQARHERAGRGIQLGALPGDAHGRDGVDEAGGLPHDELEPLVGRGRRGEEHAVETGPRARGDPVPGGIGRDVGRDEPRAAGGERGRRRSGRRRTAAPGSSTS